MSPKSIKDVKKELWERRHEEYSDTYVTARGRLAVFLVDLDPFFRRLITGEDLGMGDNFEFMDMPAERRHDYDMALHQYFTLIGDVWNEWQDLRDVHPDTNGDFLNLQRRAAIRHWEITRPGAPVKALSERSDVQMALESIRLEQVLQPGFELRRSIRSAGGSQSDDDLIAEALCAAGFKRDEAAVIVTSKTVRSATAHLLYQRMDKYSVY